jgi:hypothetical protein
MAYKQGLSSEFVGALNRLYASEDGGWWRGLLDDSDLFVAIRNEYLNAYYRGCSLARIGFDKSEVIAATHYKYLLKPRLKPEYVVARNGAFDLEAHWTGGLAQPFTHSLMELANLKAAAKPLAGGEKHVVSEIIKGNSTVVDVEIALTKNDGESGLPSAKRLDISALDCSGELPTLRFYEAKFFSNSELRANEDAKVIGQMSTYTKLLDQYQEDISAGFRSACQNVIELDGFTPARKSMARIGLHACAKGHLRIDLHPSLVVVGIDGDQKAPGSIWSKHESKLVDALGRDRVMVRGDAKAVRIGGGPSSTSIAA